MGKGKGKKKGKGQESGGGGGGGDPGPSSSQKEPQPQQQQQRQPPQKQQQQEQPQRQQQPQQQQRQPPQIQQQQEQPQRQQPQQQQQQRQPAQKQQQQQQRQPSQKQQQQQQRQQQPYQEPEQPSRGKKRDEGPRRERGDDAKSYQQSQSQQFPQLQPQQQPAWPRAPQTREEMGGGDARATQQQAWPAAGRGRGGPPPSRGRGTTPPGFESTVQQQQQPQQPPQKQPWGQRGPPPGFQKPAQEQQSMPMQRQPIPPDTPSATRQQPIKETPPSRPVTSTQPTSPGGQMGKGDTKPVEDLSKRMSTLMEVSLPKRDATQRPRKEGRGRLIKVDTNHLALNIKNPNATVYHYDVAVTPERPFKFYRPALARMRETYYPQFYPAFDGKKNLYSFRRLPLKDEALAGTVSVWDDRRDKNIDIEVKIKFANSVRLGTIVEYLRNGSSTNPPQEALQALDVVLRSPATERFVQVGRSFFSSPKGRIVSLSGGLDLWYGFYQSAIIGWKPFLNVDVAHKGFPAAENCIDLLSDFSRVPRGQLNRNMEPDPRAISDFKSFILTLRVTYEIKKGSVPVKRTYRVIGLSGCPRGNKFSCNGKQITVEEYFRQEYRYAIQYPLVPCLECGSKEKPISLPMELCRVIEGQNVNRKLNEEQTRNMVREAAVSTDLRRKKIEGSIRDVRFNNDPCVQDFGLSVNTQFTEVDARILSPPNLLYKNQNVVAVDKGVWRTGRFISSNPLVKWAILCANNFVRRDKLQEFADQLQRLGVQVGMQIGQPSSVENCNSIRDLNAFLQDWKKNGYQLAVIVLPDRGPVSYAKVKQVAEQDVGILTQCLKSKTLQKLSPATVTNILLKLNSKHNGINHNITCSIWEKYFKRPVIVFGADVTHPSPGQTSVPSVAAVAASYEPKAFSYNMEWRFQPPREEMILDLEEIVIKQLKAFYNYNRGLKPEKILFYRDGVSEGQFRKVLETELRAIRSACAKLGAEYKPPITFLVVQKRHHTRFFPRPEDADGRNRNVPAGTVVDTLITHMSEMDFYLVSHASIQGTSRPTKYHVLWDDANMSEDDIEEITYYLCHLFTRCTRAVSYPAPTYYSHLAAFRIRSYYEDKPFTIDDLRGEQQKKKIREDLLKNSPMFFV